MLPRAIARRTIIPVFERPKILSLAKRLLLQQCKTAETAAVMVNVRSHWERTGMIRCFYLSPESFSIKAAVDSVEGREIISKEIGVRRVIDDLGKLITPRILKSSVGDEIALLHEEWVEGRNPKTDHDMEIVVRYLFPMLENHYNEYGVQMVSLSEAFGLGLASKIREVVDRFDWSSTTDSQLVTTVSDIESKARTMCTSLCHADLNLGHVVLSRLSPPVLIDWDAACVAPIAIDFVDMIQSDDRPTGSLKLLGAAAQLLERLCPLGAYTANEQLLLASLRKVFRWEELSKRFESEGRPERTGQVMRRILSSAEMFLTASAN